MNADADEVAYRPVSYSSMALTELMIPAYANFSGKIHGGLLLSLMDKVAYACASKHSGAYCVTVSVDGVDFRHPVNVGEMVSLLASVNYVGRSSMVVGIKVIAEDFLTGTATHTNTSFFTMVAKDDKGHPTQVPGLVLESREEARRFIEAMRRLELRDRYRSELHDARTSLQVDDHTQLLAGKRCRAAFDH